MFYHKVLETVQIYWESSTATSDRPDRKIQSIIVGYHKLIWWWLYTRRDSFQWV